MGLIKEPKNVDLSTKSEPWSEQELADFRKIMQQIKMKNARRKIKKFSSAKKFILPKRNKPLKYYSPHLHSLKQKANENSLHW